jgi:PKD repeat protein
MFAVDLNITPMKSTTKKIIISILASFALYLNASAISDALKVKIINGTYTDEAVIRFVPTATNGFDGSWDAYKIFSTSAVAPAVYTMIDSVTELSINAFPNLNSLCKVALFTHIKVAGTYTLQAIELGTGFQPGVEILLEDLTTGILYNFKGGNSVTLPMAANTVSSPNRFAIHVAPPMSLVYSNVTCNSLANGSITATKPGNSSWNYELKDSAGTLIQAATGINETALINGLAPGAYSLYTFGATTLMDSSSVIITEPLPIIASFSSIDTVLLSSAELLFSNNSINANMYTWDFGDGSATSDSISPVHQYYTAGTFTVNLVAADSQGCSSSFSKIITVNSDLSTGISGNNSETEMNVFQQEGALQINIRSENSSKMTVAVYNNMGQVLANYSSQGSRSFSESIELKTSGTYIVHALIGDKLSTQKISVIK